MKIRTVRGPWDLDEDGVAEVFWPLEAVAGADEVGTVYKCRELANDDLEQCTRELVLRTFDDEACFFFFFFAAAGFVELAADVVVVGSVGSAKFADELCVMSAASTSTGFRSRDVSRKDL